MTSLTIIGYNVIMVKTWLGVVGRNGSGKSTVCDYLSSQGFHVYSLSDIVRHHAQMDGLPMDRDTLTELANQLKDQHGKHYFATCVLANAANSAMVVFDSIRHPLELETLRKSGVCFIGVHAPLIDCYERIVQRAKGTDHVTFEEFKRQDDYEMNGKSSGQLISECLGMCDYSIENSGDIQQLHRQVDHIVNQLKVAHAN